MSAFTEENAITAESLASEILTLSRNSLLVNLRFLDRAVSRLEFAADENFTFETDGVSLFYDPMFVLSQYRSEPSVITRNLLHSLLHCVFCHSFIGADIDRARWDLACDMAVEASIRDLHIPALAALREELQCAPLAEVQADVGTLTAEKIYRWLRDRDISKEELILRRSCFQGDGHDLWYGTSDSESNPEDKIRLRRRWEEVSRRMQTELETVSRREGTLVQNLRRLNRSRRSYDDILRRFSVYGEVMHLSDEEFDNNYYTYGLRTYGNLPLVEPLEYSEQRRIRDFVIAIDTSGSVRGEVVQRFIQHTYDLLSRQESFFSKINMYILQCDWQIRDAARIRSRKDFDAYIADLQLKGFEQTDFRPVFQFIDDKRRDGELRNLRGLIYFTDGLGIFPISRPDYETAFILHSDREQEPPVPVWAMHMTMSEEDILDGKFSS